MQYLHVLVEQPRLTCMGAYVLHVLCLKQLDGLYFCLSVQGLCSFTDHQAQPYYSGARK